MGKTLIEIDKKVIAVNDYGSQNGKVLVVNHGMIASIYDESLFDTFLEYGYRLIFIARPGYGQSSVFQMVNIGEWGILVDKVLNQLTISSCSVLGISSGAPYSYALGKSSEKIKNIYILSGTPALYLDNIQKEWPFPVNNDATITEFQKLAKDIFFGKEYLPNGTNINQDDSYKNDCYGIALDLYLRTKKWGFLLEEIEKSVFMEHMKDDSSVPFICAELTKKNLKKCIFTRKESGGHFNQTILNDFFMKVIHPEENKLA